MHTFFRIFPEAFMKKIILYTCTSFTALTLAFAVLQGSNFAPVLTAAIVVQLFIITLSIALLMHLAETILMRFEVDSPVLELLIRVFICYGLAMTECILFGMIPASLDSLLLITPAMVPTFIVSYAANHLVIVGYAEKINKAIHRQNEHQSPHDPQP